MRHTTRSKPNLRPCGRTTHRRNCGGASPSTGPHSRLQDRDGGGGSPSPAAWPPLAWRRSFSDGEAAGRVEPEPTVVLPQPAPPVEVEDSGLTRLAYQRALARSPEDLDALLDKDAMAAPEPNPELVRICCFHSVRCGTTRLTRRRLMRHWNLVSALPAPGPVPALPRGGAGSGRQTRPRGQRGDEVLAGLRPPADPGQGPGEAPSGVEQGSSQMRRR